MKPDMYVYLSPSLMCNLRHTFCFQTSFSTERLSDEILYKKLLPLYPRIKTLRLLGGEPTIIPGMIEYIIFLGENYPDMQINIVTNGVNFDREWVALTEKYNIIVSMSVNSTSECVTDSILEHGDGKKIHQKVHDNLMLLTQAHNNSEKSLVNAITLAVCDKTIQEIKPFAKLAINLGLNAIFQFPCEMGAKITVDILEALYCVQKMKLFCIDYITIDVKSSPCAGKHLEIVNDIQSDPSFDTKKQQFLLACDPKKAKERVISSYENYIFKGDNKFKCLMPHIGLSILANGDVIPCSSGTKYVLGNLYFNDIEEILKSDARRKLQIMIDNNCYEYCWPNCNNNFFPATSQKEAYYCYSASWKKAFDDANYADVINIIETSGVISTTNNPEMLYCYAFSLHMEKQQELAVNYYTLALKNGFPEFWVRYNRGSALKEMKLFDDALRDIEKALLIDNSHGGAYDVYKSICQKLNKATSL